MQEAPAHAGSRAELRALLDGLLRHERVIVAANRGPMEYHMSPEGEPKAWRGSGGVVTALSSLTNYVDVTWIASAMGEGDRRVAEAHGNHAVPSPFTAQRASVRFVVTSRRAYHKYYNVICNPLLWYLQHYMWPSPYLPMVDAATYDAWDTGYVEVNRQFADAIVDEASRGEQRPLVMVHDYQLYLVPGMVRARLPEAYIHHFNHIPWPAASYWTLLPAMMRSSICQSLCSADIVGFQAERDVRAFLACCEEFMPDGDVDHGSRMVRYAGGETLVRAYPISIAVDEVRAIAASPRAMEYRERLLPLLGRQTIVRVDRAEPSKNIVRGFAAYALLLERHPELRGNVRFLAFLVPSRLHLRQYQRYVEDINESVDSINTRFGNKGWQPVQVFFENNYVQAIAAMRLYDVLLVNPVIDGMNLVAKEGPVVNERDGVLVLSETAGAHAQLRVGALSVAPADLEGTCQALYRALTMPADERATRQQSLAQAVEREDITDWLVRQLRDVRALAR